MRIPAALFWVLLVLALFELRSEIVLQSQNFTWTGLFYAAGHHKLASIIVLLSPWWFLSAGRSTRSGRF